MREANLYVATLDGNHLDQLRENPAHITQLMNMQSEGAAAIKKGRIER